MKQKDIALIAVIVIISAVISLFVSKAIFGTSTTNAQQVENVSPISSNFPTSQNSVFFNGGFDPTQLIQISPNNNTNPFNAN
ncbi:MAG TPA: hypothetical protein VFN31_00170 [Candidatus Saccharimonadales bacterium]|nr:hypothetical protein [Candidatus Saccharimonadales bacterium]